MTTELREYRLTDFSPFVEGKRLSLRLSWIGPLSFYIKQLTTNKAQHITTTDSARTEAMRQETEREREGWVWSNVPMMRSLNALRATAPLCSWSPAPGRPLPVLTVAPQRTSHPQHFAHPLLLPHQYDNSEQKMEG